MAWHGQFGCNVAFQNVTAVPLRERMNYSNEVIQAISLTNKLFGILIGYTHAAVWSGHSQSAAPQVNHL